MNTCITCKYRNKNGYCLNEKISEDFGIYGNKKDDMLIYDYFEGGSFWVGKNFGCIHHTSMTLNNETT